MKSNESYAEMIRLVEPLLAIEFPFLTAAIREQVISVMPLEAGKLEAPFLLLGTPLSVEERIKLWSDALRITASKACKHIGAGN